jgi:heme O synthase-like polyprenyltransferase
METVKALLIHLVVPAAGLQWFLWLRGEMREEQVENPPVISLFIIFATYGGLLLVILTTFFWYWSGMASPGLAYLLFLAPIVMLVIAWRLYPQRKLSRFHRAAFIASICYVIIEA